MKSKTANIKSKNTTKLGGQVPLDRNSQNYEKRVLTVLIKTVVVIVVVVFVWEGNMRLNLCLCKGGNKWFFVSYKSNAFENKKI